ncbi:MAG: TonB-dependent receptor, partial [Calditrichia bacterium]|nr:TonB-dependent receptor [Calditrichia bacterium]
FAELHNDRYRVEPESGESKGFEIYLKNDTDRKFSWWASYGYAIAQAMIDGIKTPRDFDQHHTVYLDFNYKPNKKWRINLAWQYHSGWPFTESKIIINNQWPDGYIDYDWIPGKLNANRLPAYHRMDVRANRDFKTSHGRISAFFEIRNFYNHHNIREYIYEFKGVQNGEAIVERTGNERFLPLLPSFGISWEF